MTEDLPQPVGTFTLPGTGTIKLSEIKAEFNRNNNLTSYYGLASGIPSSGTIKLTDFYGKSSDSLTYAPYGNYGTGGPPLEEEWYEGPGTGTWFMDSVQGTGDGDPVKFGNYAGVVGANIYSNKDDVIWQFFVGSATQSEVTSYARYPRVSIQVDGQSTAYYTVSSWSLALFDTWPYAVASSSGAGAAVRDALNRNRPFFVSLQK